MGENGTHFLEQDMPYWLIILSLSALMGGCTKPVDTGVLTNDKADTELSKFDGQWEVADCEKEGKNIFNEKDKAVKFVVNQGKLIVTEGKQQYECQIKVTDYTEPKRLDITEKKNKLVGIYKFVDDKLVVCLALLDSDQRPTIFNTSKDSGTILLVFNRAKK